MTHSAGQGEIIGKAASVLLSMKERTRQAPGRTWVQARDAQASPGWTREASQVLGFAVCSSPAVWNWLP